MTVNSIYMAKQTMPVQLDTKESHDVDQLSNQELQFYSYAIRKRGD